MSKDKKVYKYVVEYRALGLRPSKYYTQKWPFKASEVRIKRRHRKLYPGVDFIGYTEVCE